MPPSGSLIQRPSPSQSLKAWWTVQSRMSLSPSLPRYSESDGIERSTTSSAPPLATVTLDRNTARPSNSVRAMTAVMPVTA